MFSRLKCDHNSQRQSYCDLLVLSNSILFCFILLCIINLLENQFAKLLKSPPSMLKLLSVFPPHNVLQVKAATQEAESATPPLTITAENVTSATTTQVTKVTAHGLVPWGAARANQGLKNADSRTNILFDYFFVLNYELRIFNFVDKTVMLLLIL